MKKYYILMTGAISFICLISFTAYYLSYQKAVNDRNEISYNTKSPSKEAVDVGNSGQKISHRCEMCTINFQVKDNSQERVISVIKPEYVGMTLDELTKCLEKESSAPDLTEINKGFIRAELISFSTDEIVIKRTYSENDIPDKYFMILDGETITIYYADRKTVFEHTGIGTDNLNEEEKNELKKGISVDDEHTLISILENYSS